MAMYSAAYDDSGHRNDPQTPYMVVAGCVADVDQWRHFDREWCEVLRPLGIEVFHRTEFDRNNREGQETMLRLAQIITRRIERSFAVIVPFAEFKRVNKHHLLGEYAGFPYPFAWRFCMGDTLMWAAHHRIETPIEMFVENGSEHRGQLAWIAHRDGLGIPIPRPKSFTPLQAADLIAGEIKEHISRYGTAGCSYRASSCLNEISKTLRRGWAVIDLDLVQAILDPPVRDPAYHYQSRIIKIRGAYRALIHCWPKGQGKHPKLKKRLLDVPPQQSLTSDEVEEKIAKYYNQSPLGKSTGVLP